MNLADIVCFDATVALLESTDRDEVIKELVNSLEKTGNLGKAKTTEISQAVIARENEASTGIGKGVAIPHVKHKKIKKVVAVIGTSQHGIDFASLDKQPTYTIMLLLSPLDNPDKHLQAMETIFKHLQQEDFRKFLRQAQTLEKIKEVVVDFSAV